MNLVDAQQHKICRFVTERSYEKIFMFVKSHENFENVATSDEERSVDTDSKSAEFQINTSENIEREKKKTSRKKSESILETGYLDLSVSIPAGVPQEGVILLVLRGHAWQRPQIRPPLKRGETSTEPKLLNLKLHSPFSWIQSEEERLTVSLFHVSNFRRKRFNIEIACGCCMIVRLDPKSSASFLRLKVPLFFS
jgi:hypothetical protein